MTDKAQEIADGLRNYIAEPRRTELAGDIREALEAKEAECERLREMLGGAQNQMIEAANSMTLRGMPVHAKKLDGIIDRIDAALKEET